MNKQELEDLIQTIANEYEEEETAELTTEDLEALEDCREYNFN